MAFWRLFMSWALGLEAHLGRKNIQHGEKVKPSSVRMSKIEKNHWADKAYDPCPNGTCDAMLGAWTREGLKNDNDSQLLALLRLENQDMDLSESWGKFLQLVFFMGNLCKCRQTES